MANSSSDGVSIATFGGPTSGDDNYAAPAAADSAHDGASVDDASSDSATRSTTIVEVTRSGARARPGISDSVPSGTPRASAGTSPGPFTRAWQANLDPGTPPGTPSPGMTPRSYGPVARPTSTSLSRRPSTAGIQHGGAAIPSVGPGLAAQNMNVVGADAMLEAML